MMSSVVKFDLRSVFSTASQRLRLETGVGLAGIQLVSTTFQLDQRQADGGTEDPNYETISSHPLK